MPNNDATSPETVRVLSMHAGYRCRHSGACCTSNWPISIEADRAERMRAAMATGGLRTIGGRATLDAGTDAEGDALLPIVNGHCAFFDEHRGRLCRVQSALGHDALPLACRQFPRVVVRDPRGVSVTLSHYCPTAAAMLGEDEPVTTVNRAAGFPPGAEYEGLDARESLPPLLRPGMLMDWESWWEFERLAVALLANSAGPPAGVLAQLRVAVEHARTWSPTDGPLMARVHEAFGLAQQSVVTRTMIRSAPGTLDDGVARRFLAAHAFANWTIHLGQGLRTWLRSIEAAHALLASGVDVRDADLQLRHLGNPKALAEQWSAVEVA